MAGAHVFLHFSIGMLLGTILGVKPLLKAWYDRKPLAPAFFRWILATYFGGLFAIGPSLLRLINFPDAFCQGWWMNIFVFHPIVNRIFGQRGLLIGELLIVGIFGMQYIILLLAIFAAKRKNRSRSTVIP